MAYHVQQMYVSLYIYVHVDEFLELYVYATPFSKKEDNQEIACCAIL